MPRKRRGKGTIRQRKVNQSQHVKAELIGVNKDIVAARKVPL